jgi:hypothetical protein
MAAFCIQDMALIRIDTTPASSLLPGAGLIFF